jgi:RNA recognition motif-containing protein
MIIFESVSDRTKALKSHKLYRAVVYSPKQESTPNSAKNGRYVDPKVDLIQYDIDRRSAYFGNLPNDMSEAELEEFASTYGEVLSVKIMRKAISIGHREFSGIPW